MNRSALPFVIFLLIIAAIVAGTGTRGGRGYFAPDTLDFEYQLEYTILGGSVPIYRSRRQPSTYPLLDYLKQSGYITVLPGPSRKWNEEFHWNWAWKDGYSEFHRALTRRSNEYIEWSKADPERARLYWSTMFRWMRSNLERENSAAIYLLMDIRPRRTTEDLTTIIAEIETECGLTHSTSTTP